MEKYYLCDRNLPSEDDFVVTARRGAPFASGYGPFVLTVAGPFVRGPRTYGVESRYEVRWTVSNIMDT